MEFLAFAQLGTEDTYNFRLDSSEKAYCLTLNMRQLPKGGHRCIFALDLPHSQVHCSIYPFRPIGCRAYPLAFNEEEVVIKPWAFCPDGAWDLTQIDLGFWQEELRRHDMEFSIYTFVIGVWNMEMVKQPKLEKLDFRPFLNFLMDVYWRLEVARKEVPPEAWSGIWQQWHGFTVDGLNPLLLYMRQTADITNFDWWLRNIQKAVSEASQNICFEDIGRI